MIRLVQRDQKSAWQTVAWLAACIVMAAPATHGAANPLQLTVSKIEIAPVKMLESGPRPADTPPYDKNQFCRITAVFMLSSPAAPAAPGADVPDVWLDRCVFAWNVIFVRSDKKGVAPNRDSSVMMRKEIAYGDILVSGKGRSKNHRATVYIDPRAYGRYSENLAKDGIIVDLTITTKEGELARAWGSGNSVSTDIKSRPRFFAAFGAEDDWFLSKKIRLVENGLLHQRQSPWAWSNYEFYESVITTDK